MYISDLTIDRKKMKQNFSVVWFNEDRIYVSTKKLVFVVSYHKQSFSNGSQGQLLEPQL